MLKGNYVLAEDGPAATSLALLTFSGTGTITGTEIVQATNPPVTYAVAGTYTVNADNTGALSLNGTSAATDANGNPLTWNENLTFVTTPTGELATMRVDAGFYATGKLVTAGAAEAKGSYVLAGPANDPSLVLVGVLNLDGVGNVAGTEILNSFGITNHLSAAGTYNGTPGGFQTLTIYSQGTDSNGNPIDVTESYAFLATQSDLRMVRIDGGPRGIVTLTQ